MDTVQARIASTTTVPLGEAKNRLSEYVSDVVSTHERVTITRHGRAAAVLIALDDLASLEETLDILSDPAALAGIREAEHDIAAGDTADEATIRADLAARRADSA